MRVLNLMGMTSTKFGGIEKYNIELLRQGVDLSLVYDSQPLSSEYLRQIDMYNAPLYVYKSNKFLSFFSLIKIIIRESPDIMHYHFSGVVYQLISIFVSVFFPRIKQIHTMHCEPVKLCGIRGVLTKIFYKCQTRIIAVSLGVKTGFEKLYGPNHNIIVSYLGVQKGDVKNQNLKSSLDIKAKTLVITSIGWDIKIKGYDILVRAIARLNERKIEDGFVVILIGLPEIEKRVLCDLIDHYKVGHCFLLVGIRDDVDDFLNITDIYIQPSRTEGLPLSIMEALQYGIPIVASNVGGIPEACIHNFNGLIFDSQNADQLAYRLECLILSSDMRKRFGINSAGLSSKYLRSNRACELMHIYENALKS